MSHQEKKAFGFSSLGTIFLGIVVIGIIHFIPIILSLPNKAKQSSMKQVLNLINREQEQYFTKTNTFLDNSLNLASYQTNFNETHYRYFTRKEQNTVYTYAVPIKEFEYGEFLIFPWNRYLRLNTYVGVVAVTDQKKKSTESSICGVRSVNGRFINDYYCDRDRSGLRDGQENKVPPN
jgi:type II secretory pathway pseudopilin PulG